MHEHELTKLLSGIPSFLRDGKIRSYLEQKAKELLVAIHERSGTYHDEMNRILDLQIQESEKWDGPERRTPKPTESKKQGWFCENCGCTRFITDNFCWDCGRPKPKELSLAEKFLSTFNNPRGVDNNWKELAESLAEIAEEYYRAK